MPAKSLQSVPAVCDPMDCSPPGSSSMGFSRQEYWSGLLCPPPGDLPDPGIGSMYLTSSALESGFFTTSATWEALHLNITGHKRRMKCHFAATWMDLEIITLSEVSQTIIGCSFMSNFLQPLGLYITRLLCPWNSPGKNIGVGCHFLLHFISRFNFKYVFVLT